MHTLDFAPLMRATIGFDRLAKMLENAALAADPSFPPLNIEKIGEDRYRVTLAVAGFAPDEIAISFKQGELLIRGTKAGPKDGTSTYLHRGIALRDFQRRFTLEEHIVVLGAHQADGLLHIDLAREVPEAQKLRTIPIVPGVPKAFSVDAEEPLEAAATARSPEPGLSKPAAA